MQVTKTIKYVASLPDLCNLDGLFEMAQEKTVIQLRWPLVILSSYLLLYSPSDWLSAPLSQAIVVFYLLTNVTLYSVAENYIGWPTFYGPLILFDTIFLALTLALSGGTTPDLVFACLLTLILSCVCNDSRGLVITFLAPIVLWIRCAYRGDDQRFKCLIAPAATAGNFDFLWLLRPGRAAWTGRHR
jgi:hypothetical protein